MVRLKDIAREAGVSVMTVSKALRNAPDIAAKTKLRIGDLAKRMGYTPNLGARSLRSQETKLLGLVIPATTDPIFARIVMAIEQRALEHGYELILHHSWNQPEREETILQNLISRRVDGIFLSPVYRVEPEVTAYRELQQRGIPTVIMGPLAEFCADAGGAEASYGPIGSWDVSAVTDMKELIYTAPCKATFNADISGWDTSGVTTMEAMFRVRSARALLQ